MSIGLTANEFFHSTPRILNAYDSAFEEQDKRKDYELWRQGRYIYDAFATVAANIFKKKGAEPVEYLDAPYHVLQREEAIETGKIELSEEERKARVRAVFGAIDSQMSAVAQKRRKQ